MEEYREQTFDEERALYGKTGVKLLNCRFDGPADGEILRCRIAFSICAIPSGMMSLCR